MDFSYEVAWVKTDKAFGNRFDRYLDYECVFVCCGCVCVPMLKSLCLSACLCVRF